MRKIFWATLALILLLPLLGHAQAIRTGSQTFSPANLPGTLMWLRSDACFTDAGVTPCTNGSSIQQMSDLSGHGNNCTQLTGANQPVFETNQINGQATMRYAGSAWLQCPNIMPVQADFTKIVVMKPSSITSPNAIMASTSTTFGSELWMNSTAFPQVRQVTTPMVTSRIGLTTSAFSAVNMFETDRSDTQGFRASKTHIAINNAWGDNTGYQDLSNTESTLYIGTQAAGTNNLNGDIAEVILTKATLNADNANALSNYFNIRYGIAQGTWNKQVINHGDSISVTVGATTGWPEISANNHVGSSTYWINEAIGGNYMTEMLAQAQSYIFQLYSPGVAKNILVVFAGTNDMAHLGLSGSTVYAAFQTYCAAAHAAGFKVVGVTMLPRTGVEPDRAIYNADLAADTCIDAFADPASDPNIGQPGENTDLTYYNSDQIHPNNTGQAVLAPYIYNAINTL